MHDLQNSSISLDAAVKYGAYIFGVVLTVLLNRQAIKNLSGACTECRKDVKEKIEHGEQCFTFLKKCSTEHETMIDQHEKRLDKIDVIIERRKL